MNKLLLTTLFALFAGVSNAQVYVDLKDVTKHVGDSVRVEGKISGVKVFGDKPTSPVLLNLGADFPNQLLTVAVFPSYKTSSTQLPTEADEKKVARVVGKIELYRGKPQIVVRSAGQLSLATDSLSTLGKQ